MPRHRITSNKVPLTLLNTVMANVRSGGVIIFPTETVYGLGGSVFSSRAIRRIYELKGRSWRKPLALLVHHLEAAEPLVETIPAEAFKLSAAFWPGPLTLLLKASSLGKILTGGLDRIGIRIPDHPVALQILKAVGMPMAVTSVNRSGEKPATSGTSSQKLFGRHVDWLLDGGICREKTPSSIVDLSSYPFTVVREGAIPKSELEQTLSA